MNGYKVGQQVEVHLSDAGWVKGTVTAVVSENEVVFRSERGTFNPVSTDSGRIRPVDLTVWPCTWLVEGRDEDGATYYDCGAPTRYRPDGTGYDCDAGHEETYAQARNAQGWDYAEDQPEADRMARAGVEPRTMTGQVWPS